MGSVGGGRTGRAMSPWRVARDADGTPYYYNKVTKVVQASDDAVCPCMRAPRGYWAAHNVARAACNLSPSDAALSFAVGRSC